MSFETTAAAFREMGYEHGRNAGSWVIDGNTSSETAAAIVRGYDDGDPEVMDMAGSPLSGEFADGPFIPDLLERAGLERDYDGDDLSDLLDTYEIAYSESYWDEVLTSARSLV